jgi:PAS domain S-box-containing protein
MRNYFRRLLSRPEVSGEPAQRGNVHLQAEAVEKEIADPDELLHLIAEAAPDMLLVYDIPSRTCVYANRQVSVSLGFSRQEIEKMRLFLFDNLLHPEDLVSFSNNLEGLARLADGDVSETEYRFRRVDGEWLWFHCRTTVFTRDVNELPRQILCAARDVTEHRKYEEAIREEEILAALNRLTVRIAHDLNNPLANIKNSLFLLKNALLPNHPGAKYLQWSELEVNRIAQTIQRISTPHREDV